MVKDKLVCLGEVLYELVPPASGIPLNEVTTLHPHPGGAPANVAVAVSRLGSKVRFIGKIGRDPFGDYLKMCFAKEQIETALIESDDARTGLTFISLKADGERDFVFFNPQSADIYIQKDEIQPLWLTDAAVFHYGAKSLIQEPSHSATVYAAQTAKANGSIISFDPNIRLPLWENEETARETIRSQLEWVDIIKISAEELQLLYPGEETNDAAKIILDRGTKVVVISMGERGCRVITKDCDMHLSSMKVNVVDTTGAGDGFVGGMIYQLISKHATISNLDTIMSNPNTIHEIFSFANRVGALTTTRYGAISSLPTFDEVMRTHTFE